MKKAGLVISICLTMISLKSFGQAAVVTDPLLTKLATKEAIDREVIKTSTIKGLEENIVQTQKLIDSYELSKEAYDALSEVNTYIKQFRSLEHALKRQRSIITRTTNMIGNFEKSDLFTVREYAKISDNLNRLVESSNEVITMFDLVLQPGKTKMNDAERMSMLLELEGELGDKQSLTEATMDYYEDIYRQREAISGLDAMGKMMY